MNILFLVVVIITGASGCCFKRPPKTSPELSACQEKLSDLKMDIDQKNERLKSFNQLNADGTLRTK